MKFKKYLFIFLLYSLNINFVHSMQPDIFVQSTVNRASKILSEDISKNDKINKLKEIAVETVDIKGIGFYTLGSIRKNLDQDQKKRYSELFRKYFLKSFSSRLAEYTNPEIDVFDKEVLNKNTIYYMTPDKRSIDIDSLLDFKIVKNLIEDNNWVKVNLN